MLIAALGTGRYRVRFCLQPPIWIHHCEIGSVAGGRHAYVDASNAHLAVERGRMGCLPGQMMMMMMVPFELKCAVLIDVNH